MIRHAVSGGNINEETVLLGRALDITTREGMEAASAVLADQRRAFEAQVNHGGLDLDLGKAQKRVNVCGKMIGFLDRTMTTR